MNTKKEKRIYYDPSDMELRSSALCFSMKFKGDVATSEFLRYNVISRRGDIIELYIEEKEPERLLQVLENEVFTAIPS